MRERFIFFYIVLLASAVLSFLRGGSWDGGAGGVRWRGLSPPVDAFDAVAAEWLIALALAAAVLVSLSLWLYLLNRRLFACVAAACACAVAVLAVGAGALPMVSATVYVSLGGADRGWKVSLVSGACAGAVFAFIFWPDATAVFESILILGFSCYALQLLERLYKVERSSENLASEAGDMRELLGNQRRAVRSMEHISKLEERNRLAARIHDEIGHGMSGSILLLEGADLVMDKEPEKARATMRKVTENLRASVEEIRKVLREERSSGAEVSLARIENELMLFEGDHPHIRTRLDIEGDMGAVNRAVWTCVCENMTEALTNVLKHSQATLFHVTLKNRGRLLVTEFVDNGSGGDARKGRDPINPGIGLQNMEERAALCYGRCFFRREQDGFHVVMTFPLRDSYEGEEKI